jgi:hypothetical protein
MIRAFGSFAALLIALASGGAASAATVTIDGQPVSDVVSKDGHLMVPFRAPLESLGATVAWDDATSVASATYNGAQLVQVTIGNTQALVTSQPRTMRVAPVLENHLAYIPVETLADISHATVAYSTDGQSATVTGWDLAGVTDVGSANGPFLLLWVWILVIGGFASIVASALLSRSLGKKPA